MQHTFQEARHGSQWLSGFGAYLHLLLSLMAMVSRWSDECAMRLFASSQSDASHAFLAMAHQAGFVIIPSKGQEFRIMMCAFALSCAEIA